MTLGLGALPAFVILVMRHDLPETAVWLVAGAVSARPSRSRARCTTIRSTCCRTRTSWCRSRARRPSWPIIRKDPIRWRATLYGWIACFAQASEFSTFAFYMPVLFMMVGVSSILGTNLVTMALYVDRRDLRLGRTADDAEDRPSRHRHRRVSASCWCRCWSRPAALYTDHTYVLPFAAAAMLWGHYWDASNCMTIPTMVAKPEYRGTASGFAYMFVKLPSFLAIFLFPSLFAAIGQANATLFVAIFPLIGLLAAIFILPEVYGYEHD